MGLFGKKKSEEQIRAESLEKRKKVQFVSLKLQDAEIQLKADIKSILKFTPANYYANKLVFVQCTFYFDEKYTEIYINLEGFSNDKCTGSGDFYKIDFDLMKQIFRLFGLNVVVPK